MCSPVPEPDLGHVWIFENDNAISIAEVLGFMTLSGTDQFGCFVVRLAPGVRSVAARVVFKPYPVVTYYRGSEPGEYYFRVEVDADGRTVGEVVDRGDIELETDDVPSEFYE